MNIAIIGAGIGGLTTAIALKKAGYSFRVYEAADEIKPVGAGIMLSQNAMKAFRSLDLENKLLNLGNTFNKLYITKEQLQVLSAVDLQPLIEQQQINNIAIHRADLHRILLEETGLKNLSTSKRLINITKEDQKYRLEFEDGTSAIADYIIGADGLRSRVRNILFHENKLRDSHQICWRGVTEFDLPSNLYHKYFEAWGKGKRFGFIKINPREVYWFLLVDDSMASEQSDIMPYLNDFFPLAQELVNATPNDSLIIAKLFDLKPIQIWSKDHVCLIGDAAHATTPNLGQGACQAIEDAYVLGELMKKYPIETAFNTFPKIRKKKAHNIVNRSWTFGKLAHLSNPLAIFMRDLVMKTTPASFMLRNIKTLYALEEIS